MQKYPKENNPNINELYSVGVIAKITNIINLYEDTARITIDAVNRVAILDIEKTDMFTANFKIIKDLKISNISEFKKILNDIVKLFVEYAKHDNNVPPEFVSQIINTPTIIDENSSSITYMFINYLIAPLLVKQTLLEEISPFERIKLISQLLVSGISHFDIEKSLQVKIKKHVEKNQREYLLLEQMKVIQKELEDDKPDITELEKRMKSIKLSDEARIKAEHEIKKLRNINQLSSEFSVIRNYLEVLLGLPWGIMSKSNIEIKYSEKILDRDHFGLEKIKERIIEYLAILQRAKKIKGPILCLIGPPGVGKTSLVKSIAESIGRKYTKFSLGGIRDESEIRGHRKTYVGAMPGKIINLIKKTGTSNPVILLDEIDKMGSDNRGDPASALLEVLDPEQNTNFLDNYLEVEYDLSNCMFIATANSHNIPLALLDRMEIINVSGYVESEKIQIAKNYLIPKQFKQHNIKSDEILIQDEVILELIRYYTRESGVRSLDREISTLTRKALKKILYDKKTKNIEINISNIEEYLGVRKYNFGLAKNEDKIGSTVGLAYTEVGGDLLTIEALSFEGKGEVKTTGKLGDVMKESAQAAYSCFRTRAASFGLHYEDYKDLDIHIHFPAGAVPKDGPSAGAAIFTTIVSLMTKIAVKKTVAMTGEITLNGEILPIGGLREKLLASMRGGILTVLIPNDNVKDLKEIPANITNNLEIIAVSNIDDVLKIALVKNPLFKCETSC
jgi:ATP-dependent Lon protease